MLKLNPKPTFDADVKITVPGQTEAGTIKLTFKYMPKKAWADFLESHKSDLDDVVIPELIVGWKGMDVDYTTENLGIFLDNYPASASEIIHAYIKLVLESRVKN